jgi:hypothetical protein
MYSVERLALARCLRRVFGHVVVAFRLPIQYYCRIKMRYETATRGGVQRALPLPTWGGRRMGAGRKTSSQRAGVPHVARPEHKARYPVHMTLRAVTRLRSLRTQPVVSRPAILGADRSCSSTGGSLGHQKSVLWRCRSIDPTGTRREPHAEAARSRVGGSLPCPPAAHATRGEDRFRLCAHELAKAPAVRPRPRSLLFIYLVRRVERAPPNGRASRVGHRRVPTRCAVQNLACREGVAKARLDPPRGAPENGSMTWERTAQKVRGTQSPAKGGTPRRQWRGAHSQWQPRWRR